MAFQSITKDVIRFLLSEPCRGACSSIMEPGQQGEVKEIAVDRLNDIYTTSDFNQTLASSYSQCRV